MRALTNDEIRESERNRLLLSERAYRNGYIKKRIDEERSEMPRKDADPILTVRDFFEDLCTFLYRAPRWILGIEKEKEYKGRMEPVLFSDRLASLFCLIIFIGAFSFVGLVVLTIGRHLFFTLAGLKHLAWIVGGCVVFVAALFVIMGIGKFGKGVIKGCDTLKEVTKALDEKSDKPDNPEKPEETS
jgi:hypothetical protein